jgi:hypothetical protein
MLCSSVLLRQATSQFGNRRVRFVRVSISILVAMSAFGAIRKSMVEPLHNEVRVLSSCRSFLLNRQILNTQNVSQERDILDILLFEQISSSRWASSGQTSNFFAKSTQAASETCRGYVYCQGLVVSSTQLLKPLKTTRRYIYSAAGGGGVHIPDIHVPWQLRPTVQPWGHAALSGSTNPHSTDNGLSVILGVAGRLGCCAEIGLSTLSDFISSAVALELATANARVAAASTRPIAFILSPPIETPKAWFVP